MNYLLFDTNIFLDMLTDRRNNVSKDLINTFIKLLEFNEIKLITPNIIIHETNKHIVEQLQEVEKKLTSAIKAIDQVYGINGYTIQELSVKSYKDQSMKSFKKLREEYKESYNDYLSDIQSLISKIFQHRNCIVLEDRDDINSECLKRKIYKKAPFHLEGKESWADGLIIETLLHIDTYIKLNSDDRIIFVSGNTSDFSDTEKKEILHKDIISDVEKSGISQNIVYVTQLNKLIGHTLKLEVESAKLTEEFEKELREKEESERLAYEAELEDYKRESIGLSSLNGFEDRFLEDFRESSFAENIVALFKRLNNCYSSTEELYSFYADEIIEYLNLEFSNDIKQVIKLWNEVHKDNTARVVQDTIEGIYHIINIIHKKEEEYNFFSDLPMLLDYLDYNENISFYDKDMKKYKFVMDELYLICESGESEQLEIKLTNSKEETVALGSIDIVYGFVEYDDEGNVGNAGDDSIGYNMTIIEEYITDLVEKFEMYIEREKDLIEQLKIKFKM